MLTLKENILLILYDIKAYNKIFKLPTKYKTNLNTYKQNLN